VKIPVTILPEQRYISILMILNIIPDHILSKIEFSKYMYILKQCL